MGEDEKRRELSDKEQSLQSLITGQLNIKKYSKKEWVLIKFLIPTTPISLFFPLFAAAMFLAPVALKLIGKLLKLSIKNQYKISPAVQCGLPVIVF